MFHKILLFILLPYVLIAGQETPQNFNPAVLALVDKKNGNFLFRGNMPQINGEFCYAALTEGMNTELLKIDQQLQANFQLIDVSFLNYSIESEEINVEKNWSAANPHLGQFFLDSLYGATIDPIYLPEFVRNLYLKSHDIDGLQSLMSKLQNFIDQNKPTVIYMHCNAGKDRTAKPQPAISCNSKVILIKRLLPQILRLLAERLSILQ